MRLPILLLLIVMNTSAGAQPMPDAAFLQHALDALSAQRNKALDEAVINKAQLDVAHDELAKANARIKEMEAKLKCDAPAPDPAAAKP
jgi:hypothetical protein